MKTKMNQADKAHRAAWRLAAWAATKPATVSVKHTQTPKGLRVMKVSEAKVGVTQIKDLRTMVADLFKGTFYKGPYVHVSHRDAFLTRQAKRLEAARPKYANGEPIVTELGEEVS